MAKLDISSFDTEMSNKPKEYIRIELYEVSRVVLSCLKKGDLPLLGTLNNETRVMGRIDKTAYNIMKLLKTHESLFYYNGEVETEIFDVTQYLEVLL